MAEHLWECEHSYYCEEQRYFGGGEPTPIYETWAEFAEAEAGADMDYNLVFRWDWREGEGWDLGEYTGDDYYRHAQLRVYFMTQRKGYHRAAIVKVCRADEPAILEYLRPRWEHLRSLWEPLSGDSNHAG